MRSPLEQFDDGLIAPGNWIISAPIRMKSSHADPQTPLRDPDKGNFQTLVLGSTRPADLSKP